MTTNEDITCADLLDEYARALRGSWGSIDGRSEQTSLNNLAEAFRMYGNDRLLPKDVDKLRADLGVCPHGKRHWTEFCDEDCEGES